MYCRYSGCNRRKFQRLKLNLNVFYQVYSPLYLRRIFGDQEIEATTLDLSKGGIALLTNNNIPVWTMLVIKITLFKTDDEGLVSLSGPVVVVGEVRSNIDFENGKYRIGICFRAMDDEYKFEIDKFLETAAK